MSQQVLLRGHQEINHPAVKILFQRIFAESNLAQPHAQLAVEQLLLQALDWLMPPGRAERNLTPEWLHSLDELLHELPDKQLSLDDLSAQLGVHPVHICRTFSQYYHCTLSDYLRKLKVERSLTLIRNNRHTLTEIAFSCGFADQSHFIRCFKAHTGLTPFNYRKLIS
jgi:AraC-like DNA-binding protein